MIFFSSFYMGEIDIKDALQKLINVGIRNIELNNGKKYIFDVANVLEKFKKEHGLNFLIHNYFPSPKEPFVINLASNNRHILNKSLKLCRRAIDIGAELGVSFYSVHSGFTVNPTPEDLRRSLLGLPRVSLAQAYDIFVASVDKLAHYAREKNLRLLLENNVLARFNALNGRNELFLMCCLEDFDRFNRDFQQDNVGILLDVGHLKVSANNLAYDKFKAIECLADRIEAFHLHDNNGLADQHFLFKEDAWFLEFLPQFKHKAKFILETKEISLSKIKNQMQMLMQKLR